MRLAAGVALVAAFSIVAARRETLVAKLPGVAGLFATLGAPVNVRGVEFASLKAAIDEDGGQRILMVEGVLKNASRSARTVPDIRLSVRADGDREVYHWVSPPPTSRLDVGEQALFRARLVAAPLDGRDVKVQFAGLEAPVAQPARPPASPARK